MNNEEWKDSDVVGKTAEKLNRMSVQYLFRGYYYDRERCRHTTPQVFDFTTMRTESIERPGGKDSG